MEMLGKVPQPSRACMRDRQHQCLLSSSHVAQSMHHIGGQLVQTDTASWPGPHQLVEEIMCQG